MPDGVMNNLSHYAQVAAHQVAWAGSEEGNEEARDEDPKRKESRRGEAHAKGRLGICPENAPPTGRRRLVADRYALHPCAVAPGDLGRVRLSGDA